MRKLNSKGRAVLMHDLGYQYIAGKWFKDGEEVGLVDRLLYNEEALACNEPGDAENAIAVFRAMYGDFEGEWPIMPIVLEALDQKELKPLCYPLSEKQLAIVNRLIVGKDEMMYIVTGVGGSGKSTFGNIVKQIFGDDFAPLTLSDLSDDFKLARGVGKRLIYSDELDAQDMKSGMIKTLASKQCVTINPKYGRTYSIRWQGNLFFCCNKPPRMDISDSGLLRRICYFSMNKRIEKPDFNIQKERFKRDDLVNIVAWALKTVDPRLWFERYFMEDTHKVLMEKNSVHLCKAKEYGDYRYLCNSKGYTPYNEDNWRAVSDLFADWETKKEEVDLSKEETEW